MRSNMSHIRTLFCPASHLAAIIPLWVAIWNSDRDRWFLIAFRTVVATVQGEFLWCRCRHRLAHTSCRRWFCLAFELAAVAQKAPTSQSLCEAAAECRFAPEWRSEGALRSLSFFYFSPLWVTETTNLNLVKRVQHKGLANAIQHRWRVVMFIKAKKTEPKRQSVKKKEFLCMVRAIRLVFTVW